MSKVLVTEQYLSDIGSAIRAKAGTSEAFRPAEMASAISEIPSGRGDLNDFIENGMSGAYENNEVTKIAKTAFDYADITSVNFPNVTYIGSSAFYSCRSLTTVSFPNATSIGNNAFYCCSALTTISFPVATSIGNNAFYSCRSSLTTVSFPNATSIGGNAFTACRSLTTISFPVATTIGMYAFQSCSALTTVDFPAVTSIESYAFVSCTSLATISFPNATSIGSNAFRNCYNLLSLYLLGSSIPTLVSTNALYSTPISDYTTSTSGVYGSIYVPASLYSSYITATNWAVYSSRFVSASIQSKQITITFGYVPASGPQIPVQVKILDGDSSAAGGTITFSTPTVGSKTLENEGVICLFAVWAGTVSDEVGTSFNVTYNGYGISQEVTLTRSAANVNVPLTATISVPAV